MIICYIIIGIFVLHLLLYSCLEIHYFLRIILSATVAKFKNKVHILDETSIRGICLSSDIDTLLFHMNNARYMRELDFARVDFYQRTGLYRCIKKKGGSIAIGATTVRYRRFVKLFHRYILTSKIVFWDEKGIFMEHRFISPVDNFINAIVLTRTRLLNCNVEEVMDELLIDGSDTESQKKVKPEMPPEVEKWLECNAISSAKLRTN